MVCILSLGTLLKTKAALLVLVIAVLLMCEGQHFRCLQTEMRRMFSGSRLVLPGSVTSPLCLFVTMCPGLSWMLCPQKEFHQLIWCVMSEVAPGLLLRNCGTCLAAPAEICSEQSISIFINTCVFVLPEMGWVPTKVSAVQISF